MFYFLHQTSLFCPMHGITLHVPDMFHSSHSPPQTHSHGPLSQVRFVITFFMFYQFATIRCLPYRSLVAPMEPTIQTGVVLLPYTACLRYKQTRCFYPFSVTQFLLIETLQPCKSSQQSDTLAETLATHDPYKMQKKKKTIATT